MLVDDDWISLPVHIGKAGMTRCALICLLLPVHRLTLELADVRKCYQLPSITVPPGLKVRIRGA